MMAEPMSRSCLLPMMSMTRIAGMVEMMNTTPITPDASRLVVFPDSPSPLKIVGASAKMSS